MPTFLRSLFAWLRSVWSEKDGTGSSTRVNVTAVTAFVLGFITALVWKVRGPITVAEFCQGVASLGTFATEFVGVLYGFNRLANWADNKTASGQQSQK